MAPTPKEAYDLFFTAVAQALEEKFATAKGLCCVTMSVYSQVRDLCYGMDSGGGKGHRYNDFEAFRIHAFHPSTQPYP